MQGCLLEGKSSLVAVEEGWRLVVVPVRLEERGLEEQAHAPFPASAEGWACFPGSTGQGSGGKCLQAAQLGRLGQTAPTSGVTTAWRSTLGCQTYRGGRPGA